MPNTSQSRGFTLIEIMMVVAIIGILSAVAIPMAGRATLRSKQAEISYMLTALENSIEDVYRVNGQFPSATMDASQSPLGSLNPPTTGTGKRYFDCYLNQNWKTVSLSLQIEGATYYSYEFNGWENGSPGASVQAVGDIDGDGVVYSLQQTYLRETGAYQLTGTVEPNPGAF
ncbi:MAG TPA: prepilin-type N-terminal cleavage/methylation domain-containing protein [Anaeromyxobacteraceae bacterium]|nr:prepilin-type N-terminal cleavage/methylation domain-containing protein [Anaeromyxobacteraceae bacterium]